MKKTQKMNKGHNTQMMIFSSLIILLNKKNKKLEKFYPHTSQENQKVKEDHFDSETKKLLQSLHLTLLINLHLTQTTQTEEY